MHDLYIRALLVSFVLVSGMFILSVGVEDAFANKGGVKGGQGEPQSCDKKKNPEKNPNCNKAPDADGDGIPDDVDICDGPHPSGAFEVTVADQDGDGHANLVDASPCDSSTHHE